MKTKIAVMNDRNVFMYLQVQDKDGSTYHSIHHAEAKVIEMNLPDNTVPFFKVWETGQALLSFIDSEVIFDRKD